jgi:NAD+ diphosphatase
MTSHAPIAFAGAPLDLVENRRSASDLSAFLVADNARAFVMFHGQFLVKDGALVQVHPSQIKGSHLYDPGPLFLGLDGDVPQFTFSFAKEEQALALVKGAKLDQLRNLAYSMDARQLALAGRAKSLFDWHRSHRFCSNCGLESKPQAGGVTRKCPSCDTDHFPRVNPVVIMLVLANDEMGEKCLLGRGPEWPEGAYSALAGFVSPGESLSEACIREVKEEVNIDVENPIYKFSQPWPFPGQLMMGLFCTAKNTKITLDTKELADAKWFSKDTIRGVFAGTDKTFICPPDFTIAHQLIKAWLAD